MSEFKAIETQEQLDAVIGERIKRERETSAKRYEGWLSPDDIQKLKDDYDARIKALEDAAATTQQELASKDKEIADSAKYRTDLEKTRIALAAGLSIEQAGRIRGDNADEWTADAKKLAEEFNRFAAEQNHPAPLGNAGATNGRATRDQFADFASAIFND